MDATVVALRSVSDEQVHTTTCLDGSAVSSTNVLGGSARSLSKPNDGPSTEVLLTLLWSTSVFERQYLKSQRAGQGQGQACMDLFVKNTNIMKPRSLRVPEGFGKSRLASGKSESAN
jgi:hypothetical protein